MGLLQDLFGDDDAACADGVWRKLEAIHADIRRQSFIISQGDRKLMADIDALNAAVAEIGADETAEEALGVSFQAAIEGLQAQVAAGNPNLQPAIAALTALDAKIKSDTAAGGTLLSSLTPPAAATPAPATVTGSGAATVAPGPITAPGVNEVAPAPAPGSGAS